MHQILTERYKHYFFYMCHAHRAQQSLQLSTPINTENIAWHLQQFRLQYKYVPPMINHNIHYLNSNIGFSH